MAAESKFTPCIVCQKSVDLTYQKLLLKGMVIFVKEPAVAIITARGGSKRIPHKNIREFCGKPIIQYPIEAALDSELFTEVMVSTDDEKIARISQEAGTKVPFFRSVQTADDYMERMIDPI